MSSVAEQFASVTKTHFEAQLSMMTALTNKAIEAVEKVAELNMTAVKTSLEESTVAVKQILSAKDPQEFFSLSAAQKPNAEKALDYSRQLTSIATSELAEFAKVADAQMADTSKEVMELVEEVRKNAPAGTENAVEMIKAAIGNANAGYEQLSKVTKQVVGALEGNVNDAVNQFTQAAAKTSSRARK